MYLQQLDQSELATGIQFEINLELESRGDSNIHITELPDILVVALQGLEDGLEENSSTGKTCPVCLKPVYYFQDSITYRLKTNHTLYPVHTDTCHDILRQGDRENHRWEGGEMVQLLDADSAKGRYNQN